MTITSTLLKIGAAYAAGRVAKNVSSDDVRNLLRAAADFTSDDLRRHAWDMTDDTLGRVGLQRRSTIPSSALLVLSGVGAGVVLGIGAMAFLEHTETGRDLKAKIADVLRRDKGEAAAEEGAESAEAPATQAATHNGEEVPTEHHA